MKKNTVYYRNKGYEAYHNAKFDDARKYYAKAVKLYPPELRVGEMGKSDYAALVKRSKKWD